MNYSISEFRKNIREALNKVEAGELVTITRHDSRFVITTARQWNDAVTEAQQSGIARLITDDKSHNIRPDVVGVDLAKASADMSFELKTTKENNEIKLVSAKKIDDSQANKEKACCALKLPCKHWSFDEVMEVWVNVLSGRERSPNE